MTKTKKKKKSLADEAQCILLLFSLFPFFFRPSHFVVETKLRLNFIGITV